MSAPALLCPFLPVSPRPIALIGAGGIVRDAHLPAYRKAGFDVIGVFDIVPEKADTLARDFGIPTVYRSLDEAAAANAVFDVAVPASAALSTLAALPDGATALLQKPMGQTLSEARAIRDECRRRRITAAVNFQLRFAPYILAARQQIEDGAIGEVHDLDVRVTVHTPWHLWSFFEDLPRVEILYHSIHYLDLVRAFLGEPGGIYAKTLPHPAQRPLASTRSAILLDYGERARATITTNHGHRFGLRHPESYIRWEGTAGAIVATMGLLLDYPTGQPDALERIVDDGDWEPVPFAGSWFPDGFIGTMGSLQRFAEGSSAVLPTSVEDAYRTMALVEAAYRSSATGATPITEEA